jgi:uncharacterized protein YyaL (SSP411 family)
MTTRIKTACSTRRAIFIALPALVIPVLLIGCQQEPVDSEETTPPTTLGETTLGEAVSSLPAEPPTAPRTVFVAASLEETAAAPAEKSEPAPKEEPAEEKPSGEKPPGEKKKNMNRLARETSPYLLLHAHNPVDWYPWGPEAFEKAKKEDKPIFLSIGYSSCYWCHVMERLVFENEKIAKFMNDSFVNIKVDREERPDVDDIYMTSLQVYFRLAGSRQGGGWPLSIFLTPEGKPIAGGTYFPPEAKDGRASFPDISERIVDIWKNRREEVEQGAETIARIVRTEMKPAFSLVKADISRELVETVTKSVVQSHDVEYGGLDFRLERAEAPKFPVPTKLALLQHEMLEHDQSTETQAALYGSLDAMAAGGIRDHLGGGFHRYSTDRKWLVPHFEKMLYDNAQLAGVYTEAWRTTKNDDYRAVVEEIFGFVLTSMRDKNGAFHSALDAETNAIEGEYYVWSKPEVQKILGPDAPLFLRVYGFEEPNDFEHGYVIHLPRPLQRIMADERIPPREFATRLYDAKRRLLDARGKREMPLKDDKVLTAWNGLMISSLARAGMLFNKSEYIAAAEDAAMFIVTKMRDKEGRLLRTYRADQAKLNAYLDDYAFLVESLLVLHEATRNPRDPERGQRWLNAARRLTDDQLKMFWDEAGGGFFFTSHHHEALLARTKNAWDSVLPSGNSVSVRNLIRLASLTGDPTYRDKAKEILELFSPAMQKNPRGMTNMALAMSEYLDDPDFRPLIESTPRRSLPQGKLPDPNQPPPGTPPKPSTKPAETSPATTTKPAAKKDKISASAFLSTPKLVPGKSTRIAFVLKVDAGWHINPNPADREEAIATSVKVKSKLGSKLTNISYPDPTEHIVDGVPMLIYEGEVKIFGDLEVPAKAVGQRESLQLHIEYQACTDEFCDRPRTVSFVTEIDVAKAGETVSLQNETIFKDDDKLNP